VSNKDDSQQTQFSHGKPAKYLLEEPELTDKATEPDSMNVSPPKSVLHSISLPTPVKILKKYGSGEVNQAKRTTCYLPQARHSSSHRTNEKYSSKSPQLESELTRIYDQHDSEFNPPSNPPDVHQVYSTRLFERFPRLELKLQQRKEITPRNNAPMLHLRVTFNK